MGPGIDFYGAKGWIDRRYFYAYVVGAAGIDLCDPVTAAVFIDTRGIDGHRG